MKLRTALASLAVASGLAGSAQAAPVPSWGAPQLGPVVATVGLGGLFGNLDCAGCIDVKLAPAPAGYRRGGRWRPRHHRARHGRVLRVRG